MPRQLVISSLASVCVSILSVMASANDLPSVDFDHDVRPILIRHCDRCHGTKNQEADLQLNRRVSVLHHGDGKTPIIVPGHADQSLLITRLSNREAGDIMPLDGEQLADQEIRLLSRWIDEGAVWPDASATAQHWAWTPVTRPLLPDEDSQGSAIDQFVRRRLATESTSQTDPLDRPRLIRRVSLALVGIPPTPAEVDTFVSDESPDAYEKVVDRLLASPRYGERWAVPWMDLARYADSNGFQADQLRDNWAWRDWVIQAFNADMPFDEFVIDQLAGDLLPDATLDQKIATGFHRMTTCNVEAGVHPEANRVNQIVDRVNTTATAFMGVTLECAQCHDHKYDPFTQKDYYQLFAYFNNSPLEVENTKGVTWDFYGPTIDLPVDDQALQQHRTLKQRISVLQKQLKQLQQTTDADASKLAELKTQLADLHQRLKDCEPDTTLVMVEMEQPRETFVFTRGDYEQPGDRVTPGTPESLPSAADVPPTGDRLELARWLTSPSNPLLARVTVNRWWADLFGIGLVATPEDFGTQADAPSHPQLLDWLAAEFVSSGWSMKHMHKLMVVSQTWQQAVPDNSALRSQDPSNRLLTRGPRFRLPAEMIRDNALTISGLLSTRMYGTPVMPWQPDGVWRSVGRNQPKWSAADNEDRFRRGVYVICKRAAPYPSFITFDAPSRGGCTVQRSRSNTPLQALTLLNDRAYSEMALAFADRILVEAEEESDADRMTWAMKLAVARSPSQQEVTLLQQLLNNERQRLTNHPKQIEQRIKLKAPGTEFHTEDQTEIAAWFAIANTILNLDETMTQ
jgi:hypothetical protein